MPMPSVDDAARSRYEALLATVEEHGGLRATMFGMPSFKFPTGKVFGGLSGSTMVAKVTDPDFREELLDLPGVHHFDPSGHRPLKEWVQLGPEHESRYADIMIRILDDA